MSDAPAETPADDGAGHYAQLLAPEYGFLLAVVLTMLTGVVVALVAKVWLTLRPSKRATTSKGTARRAFLVADIVWIFAHIVAFIYFGVRISTMQALTTLDTVPEGDRTRLGRRNLTCQALFLITQYSSAAYVLCAVLAVPTVAKKHSPWQNTAYIITAAALVFGILVSSLPLIGCNPIYIFGDQSTCPGANARLLPPLIICMVLDLGLILRWLTFVRSRTYSNSGRQGSKISLPIAAFLLRLLITGADIAYAFLYVGFDAGHNPLHYLVYPEAIAVGTTLLASSAISLSRTLGKLNFGTVAYTVRDEAKTDYGLSSMNGARFANQRAAASADGNPNAGQSAAEQRRTSIVATTRLSGWKNLATTFKNNVSSGDRDSGSEAEILQDGIYRKVEVSQEVGRSGTASTMSKKEDYEVETHAL